MTEAELAKQKAQGNVTSLPQPVFEEQGEPSFDFEDYLAVLEAIQRPKRYVSTVPTFVPRNLAEQIQFYDDAEDRRVYFYFNGGWSYTTLT